jgi:hypothetical protein
MKKEEAHLGIESILYGSDWSTLWTLAYPLDVRVLFSIASQIDHPWSLHLTSPVVRHITNMLSNVCRKTEKSAHTNGGTKKEMYLRPGKICAYFQKIIFLLPSFNRRRKVSNTRGFPPLPTSTLPFLYMIDPPSLLPIPRPHIHPRQFRPKPAVLVCVHDPATMCKTFSSPHVQLAFRFREVDGGRSECQEPGEEAAKMLEFSGEYTVIKVGNVEKMSFWGKEQEVSDYARRSFEDCPALQ